MYYISRLSADIGAKLFEATAKSTFSSPGYQFFLIQKGSVSFYLKSIKTEVVLHENDVILITPDKAVEVKPIAGLSNAVLGVRIDATFMNSILPFDHHFVCNSAMNPRRNYAKLRTTLMRLASDFFIGKSEYSLYAQLYTLASDMTQYFCEPNHTAPKALSQDYTQERIREIHDFINANYYHPILLADLAGKMFLTPQYLSKFIKEHMHTTFSKYLTDIRLSHAYIELSHSDVSITTIALNNGFPNVTAFNKAFRDSYGLTPSAWRQSNAQPVTVSDLEGISFLTPAPSDHSLIRIHTDAAHARSYQKTWQDMINIGPMRHALNADLHDAFVEYRDHLPFRYVRIENIFDRELLYLDAASGLYNYTNFNVVMDFFYELKIYPHIEINYKPPKDVRQHPSEWDSNAVEFWLANNMAAYTEFLEKLLIHCINRYGSTYVSQWRFEFMMPSSRGLTYTIEPQKYIQDFRICYDIIKKLLPESLIGGPGFNMGSHTESFTEYIQAFEEDKLPLDFISFYSYGYKSVNPYALDEDISSSAILSSNPTHAKDSIIQFKNILAQTVYRDRPVYITEFTSILTSRTHISYALFQAPFICKNMLNLFDEVDGIGYMGFWDSTYFAHLVPTDFYPSTGLVRIGGIPTPSLHAFSMLARLGDQMIAYGSNYAITRQGDNRYQMIVFNYVHFKEEFCLHSIGRVDLKDTYAVFENAGDLTFDISCDHIIPGRYKVTKLSLNQKHGSILDRFLRILDQGTTTSDELLNTIINLREDEVQYYKQSTLPRQEIYYASYDDTLTIETTLTPHEVQFYEFVRVSS